MESKGIFKEKLRELLSMKPIPATLAHLNGSGFYWIYNSGMGETGYHKLDNLQSSVVESLLEESYLVDRGAKILLPWYMEESVKEAAFSKLELSVTPNSSKE